MPLNAQLLAYATSAALPEAHPSEFDNESLPNTTTDEIDSFLGGSIPARA